MTVFAIFELGGINGRAYHDRIVELWADELGALRRAQELCERNDLRYYVTEERVRGL